MGYRQLLPVACRREAPGSAPPAPGLRRIARRGASAYPPAFPLDSRAAAPKTPFDMSAEVRCARRAYVSARAAWASASPGAAATAQSSR